MGELSWQQNRRAWLDRAAGDSRHHTQGLSEFRTYQKNKKKTKKPLG
jgi:hypothetical protein